MKQEYDGWIDEGLAAYETTRKRLVTMEREYKAGLQEMETMKRQHEAEVEALKGRVVISHHTYIESAAQTEVALDETTALPEEILTLPDEIPTRDEGGTIQAEDSWALDKITALPEEIPTQKEEGRKSYAQAASGWH